MLPILVFLYFQPFQINEGCLALVSPEKTSQEAGFQRLSQSELLALEHCFSFPFPPAKAFTSFLYDSSGMEDTRSLVLHT